MARFYSQLKALELTCESKPIECLTKANWSDSLFLIRGKDEGIPAWHYILVPYKNICELKNHKSGQTIDCEKVGCVIRYRDNNGQISPSSGWGIDPTYSFRIWIEKQYGDRSFDENTRFEYEKDDIRLCTMQRLTSDQLIGIYRYYNRQGNFHYLKLFENYEQSLAYRGGIRNYDRFICLNGINIEQENSEQITERFQNQLDLPVQMLVCTPATYQFYKSKNIPIYQNLPTVQYLKPVFDESLSDENRSISKEEIFYVIQWENSERFNVVSQFFVFKSVDLTEINDICFIENEGLYQRGIIQFKGSKDQCQNIEKILIKHGKSPSFISFSSSSSIELSPKRSLEKFISSEKSVLEDLPNELLLDLFDYFSIEEIHNCFYNQNTRFNGLLFSRSNLSLISDEKFNFSLLKFYQFQIKHLKILTSNSCDLRLFPNLTSLKICHRDSKHTKQIRPEILPNLICLSFQLKYSYRPSIELINQIFSNQFQYLRDVNLRWIQRSLDKSWLKSPSLRKISIHSDQLMIIEDILQSCPNLIDLQIHFFYKIDLLIKQFSVKSFQLQRFILTSEGFELTLDLIENLFNMMPNLRSLYIQGKCRIPLKNLIEKLWRKLEYLIRFQCFIKEVLTKNERIGNLNDIQQMCSCFQGIECIQENQQFRIFATD